MKTIGEIREKIEDGEAKIYSIQEFKDLIKNDDAPSFEEVDVVTSGTCGVMSGTSVIFNIIVSDPGVFRKANEIYLNGIPAQVGPCPNEWLGSVDFILNGTAKSLDDPYYGGGFLFKDIVNGKDISVDVKTIDDDSISTVVSMDEIITAQVIGTRMAFKNYTAFTNPSEDAVESIFTATIPLEPNFGGLTFSGCGDINPLQNDPNQIYINSGTKVLINGAEGLVINNGTRSSPEKPNLLLSADLKNMDSFYMGGFKTSAGAEVFNTVAIPIPVLNEEIYKNLLVQNQDISLAVADIRGRHLPIDTISYDDVWGNYDLRPVFNENECINCEKCFVEDYCPTNSFDSNNRHFNLDTCYGCGMCVRYCSANAFKMNVGDVDIVYENKKVNVPIICRQSDKLRANKLADDLKNRIINGEFKL